jgi:pimeloyl-ACP methyl ester carboxylesterase
MSTANHNSRLWSKLVAAGAACTLSLTLIHCADHPEEPSAPEPPRTPPDQALLIPGMDCVNGQLSSGAPYEICVNRILWNGDLVIFVPGYTNPAATPMTPTGDILGISAADGVTSLGYAWATTGFRETGLLVPSTWIDKDLLALVKKAKRFLRDPVGRTYLTGGSQGGLITTLGVERYPEVFTGGGLAACGPTGSYRKQLEYVGDFRTVFDFYFDPVITNPDWPVWDQNVNGGAVDPALWNDATRAAIVSAIEAYPPLTANQLSVTKAPIDAASPGPSTRTTVLDLLRYTFVGTNDAMAKLQGLAYGNVGRVYSGSSDDAALNKEIKRFTFTASEAALQELETTGHLSRPLVTIYTTGDHIVPIWHQSLYRNKTLSSFTSFLLYSGITVSRYGHCTFTPGEVLGAFALLVLKATGQNLLLTQEALQEPYSRSEFLRAAREFGASPRVVEK